MYVLSYNILNLLRDSCTQYLVVPGLPAQHLGALEARGLAAGGEGRSCREELHVDALAQVDEDQAVVHVLRLEAAVLQEPEEEPPRITIRYFIDPLQEM